MKHFIYLLLLCPALFYGQFTQNIPYTNFVYPTGGGGSPSVLTINESTQTISLSFSCSFTPLSAPNRYVADILYTGTLPNMVIGNVISFGLPTSYRIIINNKKLYIHSDTNESIGSMSGTISASLLTYTPIPTNVIGTLFENYVKEVQYLTDTGESGLKTTDITYFDGLGKPRQVNNSGQSSSGKDIITHIHYDIFGREEKEFLSYPSANNTMAFDTQAETNTIQYYQTEYSDAYPYSQKIFDSTPLNKVLKQSAHGEDWKIGSTHEVKFDYQLNNSTTDAVKLYDATSTWNSTLGLYQISLTSSGTSNYASNQLEKTVTKDENWTSGTNNTTEEFKNKEGKIVLKRTYNNSEKHDTYYVYDQFGNLTYVIPPLVINVLSQLDGLCYQYKYDHKNRLVERKLPGKQWQFLVYDKLDRMVATGPSLSPFSDLSGNGWLITKYDAFDRPVYTGWSPLATINSEARKNLQAQYNLAVSNFNEVKTASDTSLNGVSFRYSNLAIPTTNYHILSVNYYDDYNFPNAPATIPAMVEGQTVHYNNTTKPVGLSTGSYARVLESSTLNKSENSYILYDSKARPLRNYSLNHLGGFVQVDTKLDFVGKPEYKLTTHSRSTATPVITVKEVFTYSLQNKLLTHTHQINNGDIHLLSKNDYDELGQLISKRIGGTDVTGTTYLQKVDYTYNIRGWLKGINDTGNLSVPGDPQDLFAFKINYNTVENATDYTGTKLYNGNISETYWRTAGDNKLRKYGYKYDNLNRLSDAIYQKPEEAVVVTNSFNESLEYDKNGNITKLLRKGEYDDYIYNIQIDNLEYVYHTDKPNQLMKVTDLEGVSSGFNDGNIVDNDYDYDDNGNMIFDKNKNISSISYNHLNLPKTILFGTLGTIEYLYNANGRKLKKIVTEGTTITTTDYLSGFQYKNSVLQFLPTAEGYANATIGKYGTSIFNYVYNYTDHLGNIRVSYSKDNTTGIVKIFEENHYYPFGLKHKDYNALTLIWSREGNEEQARIKPTTPFMTSTFKYKYNGKELQDELGLNVYDYGARNYEPSIGRWMNIDPLAETSRRWTPYNYVYNNPIRFIDPDGMRAASPIYGSSGQFLGTDSEGFKGEAIFMNETKFLLSGGQGMNHKTALQVGSTLNQVIGDNPSKTFTKEEINMVNNAINHMVSKTEGYESYFSSGLETPLSSSLHNGKTSSSYYEGGHKNYDPPTPTVWNQANDGVNLGGAFPAVARQDDVKGGYAKITFNLREFLGFGLTVANVQNTWVHEFGNHFLNGVPGGSGEPHAKALFNQSLHPSWKDTSDTYKENIRNVYKEYTTRDLNR